MNWPLWSGFLLSIVAFLSYPLVFERWPVTRDFPWANLLLFAIAALLVAIGLRRAFSPGRLRWMRITSGLFAAVVSVVIFANFVFTVFVRARHLPASAHAPRIGERALDFTLPDENGAPVSLAALLSRPTMPGEQASNGVLLVFSMYAGCRACNSEYRGIQQHLAEFLARGVLSREAGYTFTFLSDPGLSVIRRYDVADGEAARPAEFLLDSSGVVRWRNLTTSMFVRARPEQLLDAIRTLR